MKAIEDLKAALAAATIFELVTGEDPVDVLDAKGDFFATTLAPESDVATQRDYDHARLIALMKNNLPALIECSEALKTLTHEFELLYAFAISNGIPEAGTPPYLPARAALAKLEKAK